MPPFPSHIHLVLKRYLGRTTNLQAENPHIRHSRLMDRLVMGDEYMLCVRLCALGRMMSSCILGGSRNRYTHSLSRLFSKYLQSQALCCALGRYGQQERCDPALKRPQPRASRSNRVFLGPCFPSVVEDISF